MDRDIQINIDLETENKSARIKEIFISEDLVYQGRIKIFTELFTFMESEKRDISVAERDSLVDIFTDTFEENSRVSNNPKLKIPQDEALYNKCLEQIKGLFLDEGFTRDRREAIVLVLIESMGSLGEIDGRYGSELEESILDEMSGVY